MRKTLAKYTNNLLDSGLLLNSRNLHTQKIHSLLMVNVSQRVGQNMEQYKNHTLSM